MREVAVAAAQWRRLAEDAEAPFQTALI